MGTERTPFRAPLRAGALSCAAFLTLASSARGQAPSPEDIASARALGTEGFRLAEAGDCSSAVPKLEAAEKLYHAPTTLGRLGECQVTLGHLVAGTETLNRVVRETLPASAPAAFIAAQRHANQVLAAAQPRIGKLRIHVEGAPIETVAVTVDGTKVPQALFDGERLTDPGAHEVKAAAPGFRTVTAAVDLRDAGDATVSLRLERDPAFAVAAPESGQSQVTVPSAVVANAGAPPTVRSAPSRVPAFVALGIGGVGVAVGTVFGILALGAKASLDNACTNKICPAASQADIDAMSARATASNVGFAIGIVGIGVGTVLMIVSSSGDARPVAASPTRVRVRPWLGLAAAGFGGTFE